MTAATGTHTKGPWRVVNGAFIRDAENRALAGVYVGHRPVAEVEATAQLIAAAPDLLSLLNEWRASGYSWTAEFVSRVDSAIAKATGGEV